jgi:8-oxo-dGTP pyrophosphatase MutT (NUDIX family)
MLDLDPTRTGPAPRDAATLVVVRAAAGAPGIEVFCVERRKIGFMGGAVVFPGGKLDAGDLEPVWVERSTVPDPRALEMAADERTLRGLAVAACREALEEAAILPLDGARASHAELLQWRTRVAGEGAGALPALLASRGARLDLAALHPLARWITPESEPMRFDTRFFLFVADGALVGAHDEHETTASFWARPEEALRRFAAGEIVLAPPTHRTLEVLAGARSEADALAIAARACLAPICPRAVPQRDARGETIAVVLPGDPEHEVREARVPGRSRYVLRDGRFSPEDAPG